MVVHDRLKPVPTDEAPKPRGVSTFAVAIALSALAAGFAFAVPLAAHKTALEPNQPGVIAVPPFPSPSPTPVVVASPTPDRLQRDRDARRGDRVPRRGGTPEALTGGSDRRDRPDGSEGRDRDRRGRTPDSPTDHDKGYGNDPGGPGKDDGATKSNEEAAAREDDDDEGAGGDGGSAGGGDAGDESNASRSDDKKD